MCGKIVGNGRRANNCNEALNQNCGHLQLYGIARMMHETKNRWQHACNKGKSETDISEKGKNVFFLVFHIKIVVRVQIHIRIHTQTHTHTCAIRHHCRRKSLKQHSQTILTTLPAAGCVACARAHSYTCHMQHATFGSAVVCKKCNLTLRLIAHIFVFPRFIANTHIYTHTYTHI